MKVEIYLSPSLQSLVENVKLISVNGATVGECLDSLVKLYPQLEAPLFDKNRKLNRSYSIYVNGENTHSEGLMKPVKEGDKLYIANILVGG